jgi:hypothetical protein
LANERCGKVSLFAVLCRRKEGIDLDIRVDGYDMSKEEMISKIVQLTVENSALNLKIIALTGLLMEKGIISEEEVQSSYKNIIEVAEKNAALQGVDSTKYIEFLKSYLALEE